MSNSPVLYEGWVLKKRRKKLQGIHITRHIYWILNVFPGFARRYFTLYQTGLLSYAFEHGQPVRDQVYLNHAAIAADQGRKEIHIDSNTATFHIKCLSNDDFDNWMTVFRLSSSKNLLNFQADLVEPESLYLLVSKPKRRPRRHIAKRPGKQASV